MALQGFEVFGLVVGFAFFPAGLKDANPFVGPGPNGGVVTLARFGFGFHPLPGP